MNSKDFLIESKFSHNNWPSNNGQEIGSIFGSIYEMTYEFNRPFLYDDDLISAYFFIESVGLAVVSLERWYIRHNDELSDDLFTLLEQPTFFSIFIDASADPKKCQDYFMLKFGERLQFDWFS